MHTKVQCKALVLSPIVLMMLVIWHQALAAVVPKFHRVFEISQEDAARYREVMRSATERYSSLAHPLHTLGEKAARAAAWVESHGDYTAYGDVADGLPSGEAVSDELAVFLAYAAVEYRFGCDENDLRCYCPDWTYGEKSAVLKTQVISAGFRPNHRMRIKD